MTRLGQRPSTRGAVVRGAPCGKRQHQQHKATMVGVGPIAPARRIPRGPRSAPPAAPTSLGSPVPLGPPSRPAESPRWAACQRLCRWRGCSRGRCAPRLAGALAHILSPAAPRGIHAEGSVLRSLHADTVRRRGRTRDGRPTAPAAEQVCTPLRRPAFAPAAQTADVSSCIGLRKQLAAHAHLQRPAERRSLHQSGSQKTAAQRPAERRSLHQSGGQQTAE